MGHDVAGDVEGERPLVEGGVGGRARRLGIGVGRGQSQRGESNAKVPGIAWLLSSEENCDPNHSAPKNDHGSGHPQRDDGPQSARRRIRSETASKRSRSRLAAPFSRPQSRRKGELPAAWPRQQSGTLQRRRAIHLPKARTRGSHAKRFNFWRMLSSSDEDKTETTTGGKAWAIIWCAWAGLVASRKALSLRIP